MPLTQSALVRFGVVYARRPFFHLNELHLVACLLWIVVYPQQHYPQQAKETKYLSRYLGMCIGWRYLEFSREQRVLPSQIIHDWLVGYGTQDKKRLGGFISRIVDVVGAGMYAGHQNIFELVCREGLDAGFWSVGANDPPNFPICFGIALSRILISCLLHSSRL